MSSNKSWYSFQICYSFYFSTSLWFPFTQTQSLRKPPQIRSLQTQTLLLKKVIVFQELKKTYFFDAVFSEITYMVLKSCFFFFSSFINFHCSKNISFNPTWGVTNISPDSNSYVCLGSCLTVWCAVMFANTVQASRLRYNSSVWVYSIYARPWGYRHTAQTDSMIPLWSHYKPLFLQYIYTLIVC